MKAASEALKGEPDGSGHARFRRKVQVRNGDAAHTAWGRAAGGAGGPAEVRLFLILQELVDISYRDPIENPTAGAGLPPVQDGDRMA